MARRGANGTATDPWLHRQAYNLASQLPENPEEALKVLKIVKDLVRSEQERTPGEQVKPMRVVSGSSAH